MASTPRSTSSPRNVMSPRFPMGVATTYNPGAIPAPFSMSRFNALLLFLLAAIPPAFSAEPGAATRNIVVAQQASPEEIDPATGLARTTVVKPLREFPSARETRPAPPEATAAEGRPHIALILPTLS